MTARKSKAKPEPKPSVLVKKDQSRAEAVAGAIIAPHLRHAHLAQLLSHHALGKSAGENGPDFGDYVSEIKGKLAGAAAGDPQTASAILMAQALSLDAIFTEMARRMALNMGEHLGATQTYGMLALKAQSGSRAAIDTLAKLHQPREQTVRHVHVNEGGQAVIADQFHHHSGGQRNAESTEQPQATGTRSAGPSAALSSPDPLGNGVPIPGSEGSEAMPNARREGKRSA